MITSSHERWSQGCSNPQLCPSPPPPLLALTSWSKAASRGGADTKGSKGSNHKSGQDLDTLRDCMVCSPPFLLLLLLRDGATRATNSSPINKKRERLLPKQQPVHHFLQRCADGYGGARIPRVCWPSQRNPRSLQERPGQQKGCRQQERVEMFILSFSHHLLLPSNGKVFLCTNVLIFPWLSLPVGSQTIAIQIKTPQAFGQWGHVLLHTTLN